MPAKGKGQTKRSRAKQTAKSDSEDDGDDDSDFVPSEESSKETELTTTTSSRATTTSSKATPRPKKTPRVQASPRQQLSARKRHSSRLAPHHSRPEDDKSAAKKSSYKKQKTAKMSSKKVSTKMSSEALEAVRKVEIEMMKLPNEDGLQFTVMEEKVPWTGMQRGDVGMTDPLQECPRGHPECFAGKAFVLSGVLEGLSREDAEHLIKSHGGRVTSAVSGKTDFLIVGQETGKFKVNMARDKGTKIIDKDGLFRLINATKLSEGECAVPEGPVKETQHDMEMEEGDMESGYQLWVDKYKPTNLDELIGNPSIIDSLHYWLSEWQNVHLHQGEPSEAFPGKGKPPDLFKKAVLLSGAPGVGKTTSALLISRDLDFDPIEVNASDTRNKADKSVRKGVGGKMSNKIQVLCQNNPIMDSIHEAKPLVLVMDEVDGMSAGDRGGIADLILNIKSSKIPIICICNDRYNRKLTSLKNHCLELNFRKPTKLQIHKRMAEICQSEGLNFSNDSCLDALIDQAKGDIRLLLGGLQFIRAKHHFISYEDIRTKRVSISKNQDVNPFEACSSLLYTDSTHQSWSDRTNTVFEDLDLIPLLIQENYVNHRPITSKNEKDRLRHLAKAADYLSFGEILNHSIRSEQKWSLMPSVVHMGSLAPASLAHGPREVFNQGEFNFTRFTSFLGNLSTTNKQVRLLKELVIRMSSEQCVSFDKDAMVMDYVPCLRSLLTEALINEGAEGVPEVLNLMKKYGLTKDCYDYVMDVSQFKSTDKWAEDPLKKIPSKVKAALTRQVNAANITCPALPDDPIAGKKASKAEETGEETVATNPESGIIVESIQLAEIDEEEEEEMEKDVLLSEMSKSGYALKPSSKPSSGKRAAKSTRKTKMSSKKAKK